MKMVYGYNHIPNNNIIGFLAEKSFRKDAKRLSS